MFLFQIWNLKFEISNCKVHSSNFKYRIAKPNSKPRNIAPEPRSLNPGPRNLGSCWLQGAQFTLKTLKSIPKTLTLRRKRRKLTLKPSLKHCSPLPKPQRLGPKRRNIIPKKTQNLAPRIKSLSPEPPAAGHIARGAALQPRVFWCFARRLRHDVLGFEDFRLCCSFAEQKYENYLVIVCC